MRVVNHGKYGSSGNEESITYTFPKPVKVTNLTLTAIIESITYRISRKPACNHVLGFAECSLLGLPIFNNLEAQ